MTSLEAKSATMSVVEQSVSKKATRVRPSVRLGSCSDRFKAARQLADQEVDPFVRALLQNWLRRSKPIDAHLKLKSASSDAKRSLIIKVSATTKQELDQAAAGYRSKDQFFALLLDLWEKNSDLSGSFSGLSITSETKSERADFEYVQAYWVHICEVSPSACFQQ
jgi:hypothetical protein